MCSKRGIGIGRSQVREHIGNRVAGAALGNSRHDIEMRVPSYEAQQLAADIAGCAEYDRPAS